MEDRRFIICSIYMIVFCSSSTNNDMCVPCFVLFCTFCLHHSNKVDSRLLMAVAEHLRVSFKSISPLQQYTYTHISSVSVLSVTIVRELCCKHDICIKGINPKSSF